jgi:hypothetical protein
MNLYAYASAPLADYYLIKFGHLYLVDGRRYRSPFGTQGDFTVKDLKAVLQASEVREYHGPIPKEKMR